jgi:hypothetical protein
MELTATMLEETLTRMKSDKLEGNAARRQRPRVGLRCNLMIMPYQNGACGRPMKAWTRDISVGGMGILCAASMAKGAQFVIQLPRNSAKPMILLCTVRNCSELADGLFGIGATFAEIVRKEEAAPTLPADQLKAADIARISQAILH